MQTDIQDGITWNTRQLRKFYPTRHQNWQHRMYARNAVGNLRHLRDLSKPSVFRLTTGDQLDLFLSGSVSDTPTKPKKPSVFGL